MKKLKNKFFTEKSVCNYIRILHTDSESVCNAYLRQFYIQILTVCNSNFSCSETLPLIAFRTYQKLMK